MFSLIEKGIRGGILCDSIDRYAKANHKYMKDYDKNEELIKVKNCHIFMLMIYMVGQCRKSFL